MKKLLAIILASLMLLTLAACSKKENVEDDVVEGQEENIEGYTPAQRLNYEFNKLVANGDKDSLTPETIATTLSQNEMFPFMTMAMPIQEGFLTGFSEDITGFDSAAIIMPAIGSIPFVSYVFELAPDADVTAFVENLKDKANMRWLVCVNAEEVVCDSVDNFVFFCMAKSSFEENAPAEDEPIVDDMLPEVEGDIPAFDPDAEPETPAVEPETPAVEPETPAVEPETPAVEPETPAVEPETPAVEPETPAVEPETPAVEPETPAVEPETPAVEPETPAVDGETPAKTLLAEFKKLVAGDGDKDTFTLANTLITNPIIPFMGGAMEIEAGYLNGFNNEISGFKSGSVFMPMIGAIPFVGYIFELEEGADVDAFVETLKNEANMRWLICTAAEETVCEAEGNLVFFCMAKLSFEE